ncbi:hypothetical protein BCR39DRAFT_494484 [Naematelia encephala]|uniref:Uncharacterized protein n=1 Tax=Naematelia encephala TaxID=71784 RepID=A0A1Y2B6T4_9TREE|nr:hypothetical protein BCR39DRAFT_494484 [Naematelia encephala]
MATRISVLVAARMARPTAVTSVTAISRALTSHQTFNGLYSGLTRYRASQLRQYASTSSEPDSTSDPTLSRALELIDRGTEAFEKGELRAAKELYEESVGVRETSGAWFNLGVCEYHDGQHAKAITAWENSTRLNPSADAYTNLASAHIMSKPPQPALAIKHLTSALELAPDDPEIAFNLAAILESTDNFEPALNMYQRASKGGVERAEQNIRSISAKILARRAAQEKQAGQADN